jgi:hypothetical protein
MKKETKLTLGGLHVPKKEVSETTLDTKPEKNKT